MNTDIEADVWHYCDSNTFNFVLKNEQEQTICGTDTKMLENSCVGYCVAHFCPSGSTWGTTPIHMGGLGCVDNETKMYCNYHPENNQWRCAKEDKVSENGDATLCCVGSEFAQCEKGTCSPTDCEKIGGTAADWVDDVTGLYGGCQVTETINGQSKTIYCIPIKADQSQWRCYHNKQLYMADDTFCDTCSADDLNKGEGCPACWDEPTCDERLAGGKWNVLKNRCQWNNYNGKNVTCDLGGTCYMGTSDVRCCTAAFLNPDSCDRGRCSPTDPAPTREFQTKLSNIGGECGASNPLTYNSELDIYGCLRSSERGKYFYKDGASGADFACYYSPDGTDYVICGYECKADCTACNIVHHDACLFDNCQIGHAVDSDGDGKNDCYCYGNNNNGVITNGHCCLEGHIYVNGACQKVTCSEEQCLSDTFCVDIDSATYVAKSDSGLCVCQYDADCFNTETKTCIQADSTHRKNASGQCEVIEQTK